MIIAHTVDNLQALQRVAYDKGWSVGFVPTMGALHRGHLSLVQRSKQENDLTVVSIFVNPTQFNDKDDLDRYPRNIKADLLQLQATTCDIVFAPSEHEVYPKHDTRRFDFGTLDKVMEGARRPGHFNGVAQVVSRMFDIVRPQRAYFGEKDFQQVAVVREMVRQLHLSVQLVCCPIVREADGLALSSRNVLLTPEQRHAAPLIARTLLAAADMLCTTTLDEMKNFVVDTFNTNSLLRLDYFEVVDANTLQPVSSLDDSCPKQACIAVRAGNVRLIDNVKLA
jgi:pantoate--beta-alanine ligase